MTIAFERKTLFRKLDPCYWVAGNLRPEDYKRAKWQGFKAVVNILPDDDDQKYMDSTQAENLAGDLGLTYRHMPLYGHQLNNPAVAAAFKALVAELDGPILVHCRSGMRSTFLWGMIRAGALDVDEILDRGLDAGFDLFVIEGDLRKMATQETDAIVCAA